MIWATLFGAVVAAYVLLLVALALVRPRGVALTTAVRLLPQTVVLAARLARDRRVARRTRAWLWGLLAYLALPIDLVPDFIPVVGQVDDAIVAAVVLRHVVRRAGADAVARNWSGSDEGLRALLALAGATTA